MQSDSWAEYDVSGFQDSSGQSFFPLNLTNWASPCAFLSAFWSVELPSEYLTQVCLRTPDFSSFVSYSSTFLSQTSVKAYRARHQLVIAAAPGLGTIFLYLLLVPLL